jgi:hypothetical protein
MDRRYQVFVSSTFFDLQDERAAVVSALLQLDAMPAGMELFPAADDDAWTLIEQVIQASDYYLLVIGGRYGSVDPQTELSYTEREYDYAIALDKPVMAFLHEDPDAIQVGKSEKTEAAQERLAAFRTKVETQKHVKYWSSADTLQGKVAMSFASFIKRYPAVGWIRGDTETAAGAAAEINGLRKRLDEANAQLAATRFAPPPGTAGLSQGADGFQVEVYGETKVRGSESESWDTFDWTTWSGGHAIRPTWDELFSALGPALLEESEQRALRREVNSWITRTYGAEFRADVRKRSEAEGNEVAGYRGTKIALSDDDFGTLVVQLRALGLIQRSDRKRSVNDKGTYWTLTPYGDTHLTTLRAIQRNTAPSAVGEEADRDEREDEDEDWGE